MEIKIVDEENRLLKIKVLIMKITKEELSDTEPDTMKGEYPKVMVGHYYLAGYDIDQDKN